MYLEELRSTAVYISKGYAEKTAETNDLLETIQKELKSLCNKIGKQERGHDTPPIPLVAL